MCYLSLIYKHSKKQQQYISGKNQLIQADIGKWLLIYITKGQTSKTAYIQHPGCANE